jgi:glutathione S-transferase
MSDVLMPDEVAASARSRWRGVVRHRWSRVLARGQAGMSTAEYAVGTVAACAFAAVLYRVVTGGSVVTALGHLVQRALETLS